MLFIDIYPFSNLHAVFFSFFFQICANVMEYCESLMLQSAPSFQHTVCLFTPSLSETTNRDGPRQGEILAHYFLRQNSNIWASMKSASRCCSLSYTLSLFMPTQQLLIFLCWNKCMYGLALSQIRELTQVKTKVTGKGFLNRFLLQKQIYQ